MKYVKEKGKIYRVTTIREEVDVEALRRNLRDWEEMREPDQDELADAGRANHPYYTMRGEEIGRLRETIAEAEKAVEPIEPGVRGG